MGTPAIYGGSRTKILTSQGLLLKSGAVVDYNGPKNYITYGSFPVNATTGWSLAHTTLSGVIPNQASGSWTAANANLSISATTTGALSNSGYSLSLAASSATVAGDMLVSQVYTIDKADQAKVLSTKFNFQAYANSANNNFSGTSANTWAVYIYDVTNSVWIQPNGVYGMMASSGVGFVQTTWQTPSNMTQFRIAVVCINASAGATTLYFDDFFTGPNSYVYGSPVTDWVAYTPTFTGFGTVTTSEVFWRRVGADLELRCKFTAPSPTAVEARVSLPNNLTSSSSSLIPTIEHVGNMTRSTSTTGPGTWGVLIEPSVSYVTFGIFNATFGGLTKANGSDLTGAGASLSFFAKVPIQGWSSSVQMSDAVTYGNDIGMIQSFAVDSSTPPSGYLFCDGRAVNRTAYNALFNTIGTKYGTGDGSTTFNLPDLRGQFLRGLINIPAVTGTGSAASNNATFTAHGLSTGMRCRITSGALTGLTTGTDYYAIYVDANTLAFATTKANAFAGTKIVISGTNTAVVQQWIDPDVASRTAAAIGGSTGASFGSSQEDALQNITGTFNNLRVDNNAGTSTGTGAFTVSNYNGGGSGGQTRPCVSATFNAANVARTSTETRPFNSAVNFFIRYLPSATATIAATETVAASYWLSANFTASATTPINFDSKEFDTHGAVTTSATAWKFTAPTAGTYMIQGEGDAAVSCNIFIYKNGTTYKFLAFDSGANSVAVFSQTVKLNAGDYIDVRPGVSTSFAGGSPMSATGTHLAITRIGF